MFIRFFSKKFFIQYAVLFLLTIILWGDDLLNPSEIHVNAGGDDIFGFFGFLNTHPLYIVILSILLLYIQAVVLNQVFENHRLTERNHLLTAAIYVITLSSNSDLTQPLGILITNFILIILLNIVLNIYGRKEPFRHVFDAGFLIGLASMIYFPVVYFILFVWIALMLYQIFTWREWVIPVIGLSIPYLFAGTYFFWKDSLTLELSHLSTPFTKFSPLFFESTVYFYLFSGLIILLILISLNHALREQRKSTIPVRKKTGVLFAFLFIALMSGFFSGEILMRYLLITFIPVSMFIAQYFTGLRKVFVMDMIVMAMLIIMLADKYLQFV